MELLQECHAYNLLFQYDYHYFIAVKARHIGSYGCIDIGRGADDEAAVVDA